MGSLPAGHGCGTEVCRDPGRGWHGVQGGHQCHRGQGGGRLQGHHGQPGDLQHARWLLPYRGRHEVLHRAGERRDRPGGQSCDGAVLLRHCHVW